MLVSLTVVLDHALLEGLGDNFPGDYFSGVCIPAFHKHRRPLQGGQGVPGVAVGCGQQHLAGILRQF